MWAGYASFGGQEIINVERTVAYATSDNAFWLKDAYKSETLAHVLGDRPYKSAKLDHEVPWFDGDEPASRHFYGFYPLEITGIEDSSRTSTVVEYIGDGGSAGRLRHGTKSIVFRGALVGRNEAAVEYGMTWLRNVLLTGSQDSCCGDFNCDGAALCFYSAEPPWQPGRDNCGDPFLRTLERVTVNNGPTVLAKNSMASGGTVWQVTFTAVAGIPWMFGIEQSLVIEFPRFRDNGGVYAAGTSPDLAGRKFHEQKCHQRAYIPVFDPRCPDIVAPPTPPGVQLGCYNPPNNWKRYSFDIPASYIREWTDSVPVINIRAGTDPIRNVRVRVYANPTGDFDPDDRPCHHCSDMVVTYCPENSTMTIDGVTQTVTVYQSGAPGERADGLVLDSDGSPFTWPVLSCGMAYIVTVDTLLTAPTGPAKRPTVDFTLVPRIR